jgi:hypothetical protein
VNLKLKLNFQSSSFTISHKYFGRGRGPGPGGHSESAAESDSKLTPCVCVFITAVPITKLFAWGEGGSGGHVLRETTSRGLSGLVCPSRTSERGKKGACVKEGGGEEGERGKERALGRLLCHSPRHGGSSSTQPPWLPQRVRLCSSATGRMPRASVVAFLRRT